MSYTQQSSKQHHTGKVARRPEVSEEQITSMDIEQRGFHRGAA